MTFDEEMVGWYLEGASVPDTVEPPPGSAPFSFKLRMTVRDLNESLNPSTDSPPPSSEQIQKCRHFNISS
jgi:hypothetical protein